MAERGGAGRVKNRAPAAVQASPPPSAASSPLRAPRPPRPHCVRASTHADPPSLSRTQITAEQLLREAADFQEKVTPKPKQRIEDFEELHEYRGRKRQEFEEIIRRTRSNVRPPLPLSLPVRPPPPGSPR